MTQSSTDRTVVHTGGAPGAIGPYSQAISYGGTLYCSGSIPLDPASGEHVDDSVAAETTRCLQNLAAVCEAAGTELGKAVRLTVYTTRLELFAEINEAYAAFFTDEPPARVAIGVAALPKGVGVEIDAVVAM